MERAVLMIAYHLPPAALGSGHLRTLGFARHLPKFGWKPIVLSVWPVAYPRVARAGSDAIPAGCEVHRALALDARRHLGIGGRYPAFLAQPDRWASWWPAAVWQGRRLIRRHRVSAIWSTYPIMTAHCIARSLSRVAKLPWIADFRDPVSSSVEPGNPYSVASQQRWERRVLESATHCVFTTPGAMRDYAGRFPGPNEEGRLSVILNGYDETVFADLPAPFPRESGKPLTLLHSGLLYRDGRNPVPFLTALARLKAAGCVKAGGLRVILRASGFESSYADELRRLEVSDLVKLAPRISNRDALIEQAQADALLLFQGERYDRQIPAKLYEYLRIGRPVFALVGDHGDTASLLRDVAGVRLVPIDDVVAIENHLRDFIDALRADLVPRVKPAAVAQYSREVGAASLARLLNAVDAGCGP